ncbi:MAG: hypothetical protein KDI79_26800 [Anaerolineae bacterium]|nr:hypothetical protein [Anaerolineae bacterium]
MSVEQQPNQSSPLEPTVEEQREQAFGMAMRRAVDDLFTNQPIADVLAGTEGNTEVEHFIGVWKQGLVEFLEGTGVMAVEEFVKDFERFQNERKAGPTADTRQDVALRIDENGAEK